MKKLILHGRKAVGGCAEGKALVTISNGDWVKVDADRGVVEVTIKED